MSAFSGNRARSRRWLASLLGVACLLGVALLPPARDAEARNIPARSADDLKITRVFITTAVDEVVRLGIGGSWRLSTSDAPVLLDIDALFEVPALIMSGNGDGYHLSVGVGGRVPLGDLFALDFTAYPGVAVRDREGLQAVAPHLDLGARGLFSINVWTLGLTAQIRQPLFTNVKTDPRVLRDQRDAEQREREQEQGGDEVPPIGLGMVTKEDRVEAAQERTVGGPGSLRLGVLAIVELGSMAISASGGVERPLPLLGELPTLRPHRSTERFFHIAVQFRW